MFHPTPASAWKKSECECGFATSLNHLNLKTLSCWWNGANIEMPRSDEQVNWLSPYSLLSILFPPRDKYCLGTLLFINNSSTRIEPNFGERMHSSQPITVGTEDGCLHNAWEPTSGRDSPTCSVAPGCAFARPYPWRFCGLCSFLDVEEYLPQEKMCFYTQY